jgi:DNA-binding SARP family transcriptional activator/Tfp pilus assembly protein PilF
VLAWRWVFLAICLNPQVRRAIHEVVPSRDKAAVQFRLLGAVEAFVSGHRIDIGPARQQCVLAALLVDANAPVPVDRLVDRVWGERPPQRAVGTLHSYLTRIRRALARADGVAIVRRSGSYVLTVDEHAVDLHRFRHLVALARAGDGVHARESFEEALGLWRSEAFTGLDTPWIAMVRQQLERERLAAELDHNDLALRLGRHTAVLTGLRLQAAEHPLDERLVGQLMLALYRSGHQAEALEQFEHTRRLLAEELGSDPGPPLRRLHEAILRGEVDHVAPVATATTGRNDLPGDLADFTGRAAEVRQVLADIPDAGDGSATPVVIQAIDGMAGVGKTALAVHLAHLLADRYPDAQLFIDLQGHAADRPATDPMTVLDTLLRALGVPGDRIPTDLAERAALWRAELAARRVLVVLDNAAGSSQVRPLLPGTSRSLVLITSRRRLLGLEIARVLSLNLLPHPDAIALFAAVVGDDRAAREPEAIDEVVALCGYLPLAIRIAAARLRSRPTWTVHHLAQRLAQGRQRLSELSTGDSSVAAAFALSYDHLTAEQQRLFRLLGLAPGADFDVYAATALVDGDLDRTDHLLEQLVDVHLLDEPRPGRYRFHDLMREHARAVAARTDSEPDRSAALGRLFDYYLDTATAAAEHLGPVEPTADPVHPPRHVPQCADSAQALARLDTERATLTAVVLHSCDAEPHARRWLLAHTLWRFYFIRGHLDDWLTTHRSALHAARQVGDRPAEAAILKSLGTAYWQASRLPDALAQYQRALTLYRQLGDRRGEAAVLGNLGLIYDRQGRYPEAIDHHLHGLALYRALGDYRGEGTTLSNLGLIYERLGRYDEALDHCEQALVLVCKSGDRWAEGQTLVHIGLIQQRLGHHAEALRCQRQALALVRELGDRQREGQVLANLGHVHSLMGDHIHALDHLRQALDITRETADRAEGINVLNNLGEARRAAGLPFEADHRQALQHALELDDLPQQARAHVGLGHALIKDGPTAARTHWTQALAIYDKLGVPETDEVRTLLKAHIEPRSTADRPRQTRVVRHPG